MFECLDSLKSSTKQQPEPMKKKWNAAKPLPAELIRELLELDETMSSGLRWKTRPRHNFPSEGAWKTWNTRFAGRRAGTLLKGRIYWYVEIDGARYYTHRIIFLLANGIDPVEKHVDHICADLPLPNVASNLRLATQSENQWNRRRSINNSSGVPGVHWSEQRKKWYAQIRVNDKPIHLGYFSDFSDAVAARKAAEAKYFGEFSYDASRAAAAQRVFLLLTSPAQGCACMA